MLYDKKRQVGRRNFLSGALCPSPDISACGSRCGSTKNRKNKLTQKVLKTIKIPPESMDSSGILELLPRFELGTSSLPTAMAIFFVYFSLVYSRFCSISFALRHSLKASFPCVPHLSVAGYVVKKIVSLKEAVHKLNEALCNSLAFHLCISPFIPIDFRLLFRYRVACESPIKYRNQEEKQMTSIKSAPLPH